MPDRIVSSIVRRPSCSATSARQLYRFSDFVSSAANRDNRVVSQVRPYFVGLRNIKRSSRIPAEAFRFLDHLACAEVYGDDAFVRLSRNEQALSFDVHGEVVHVTFGRQRNRLDQSQKAGHGRHRNQWRRCWNRGLLTTLRRRNEERPESPQKR